MRVLSIDPSSDKNNGYCIRDDRKIVKVGVCDSLEMLKIIRDGNFYAVIVEDARGKGVFRSYTARRVGVLCGTIKLYEKQIRGSGAKFTPVIPQGLNRMANTMFPNTYKEFANRTEHEKVAILLHDCVNIK